MKFAEPGVLLALAFRLARLSTSMKLMQRALAFIPAPPWLVLQLDYLLCSF